ncbi:uncharacterized protein LOC101859451 isoform X3 [Aplysia californica]|uniref:Uncharacterized protein LOC101859451 isoform X3 n=1 Tax=Aplysia californica TaxID=6500 RepID=A0ABM1VRB9_APLCA|nr:uncharacterized protein LOC101859451 isoform X3 [Aplysia californica]
MNGESANKFISALVKSLQTLCQGYVEFNDGIEIIGHLYLNIDSGSSFDYIVKEKVCKNAENSTIFVSKSYAAQTPPDEVITRRDKGQSMGNDQGADFEDASMSPTAGTSRLQSAITSISNVLSGAQDNQKSRHMSLDHSHLPSAHSIKRKREHNGNYSGMHPPYKYTTLQSSSSSSAYFNSAPSKQAADRNHSEQFSSSSHAEFFGGDSNQSSDPSSSQSNLHDNSSVGGGSIGYPNSDAPPQQFTSGTAGDLGALSQSFQDPSQLDMGQHHIQGPPNPRTLRALHADSEHLVRTSPVSSPADLIQDDFEMSAGVSAGAKDDPFIHTARQTKWAVARAREWLTNHGMSPEFEIFTETQLNQMMAGFYTTGQKKGGAPFSATALLAFRTAVNRHLNKCGRQISLATSHAFKESNAVLARIQSTSVRISKTISVGDIKLLYSNGTLSNSNPQSLLHKVWFELQIHFRAKIDWSQVSAEQFFFSHDPLGRVVVTWNTRGYGNCNEVTMIEPNGGPYCPVQSLRLYLQHRNRSHKAFLQVPVARLDSPSSAWYLPEEVRDHKEKQMMKKISALGKLSQIYTNACVLASFEEHFQAISSFKPV